MRVKIIGDNLAARTLKGYLEHIGYAIVKDYPNFEIEFVEGKSENGFIIDGVDSDLERRIIFHLEDLGVDTFTLQRKGGIRNELACKITYPVSINPDEPTRDEITARAVARSIQEVYKGPEKVIEPPEVVSKPWYKKLFLLPLLVLMFPNITQAQDFVYGRAWDSVNIAAVDPGDSTNRALRVNLVAGTISGADGAILDGVTSSIRATVFDYTNSNPLSVRLTDTNGDYVSPGGATPFTDNNAFTGGSTSITNIGALYDATPPAITDGNSGIFRMNSSRILLVDGSTATQPISGTITANAGTNLNTSLLLTTTSHDNAFGTAGSADAQVRTVQGIAGATPVIVGDGTGALNVIVDSIAAGDNNIGNVDIVTMPNVTIGTFPDNEPINVAQIAGVAPNLNSGDITTGTQRVVLGGAPTLAHNQVSVATTAGGTVIVAARAGRRSVVIINHGSTAVFIGNTGLTTSTGLQLIGTAGATISIPTSAAVYGIVAAGTQTVSYMEVY